MNPCIEVRHSFLAACFGVIPAMVMSLAAMLGFAVLKGWVRLLGPASIVGTIGLLWAVLGVQFRHRWHVVVMLGIGELAMLPVSIAMLANLGFGTNPIWVQLAGCWLVLGPMLVGASLIFELCRGRLHQECVM